MRHRQKELDLSDTLRICDRGFLAVLLQGAADRACERGGSDR